MPKLNYPDNSIYFLTGSTYLHYPYFKEAPQKQLLLNQFQRISQELGVKISAFSIAINHYHLLIFLDEGKKITKIKKYLHGAVGHFYREKWPLKTEQFWHGSQFYLVNKEDVYWKILGYVIGNLLKHKEVGTFEELKNNPFSSYRHIAEKYDDEFAQNLVREVINLEENEDNLIDLKTLWKNKFFHTPAQSGVETTNNNL